MKLIDRKTLLQMPKGTVFAKKTQIFEETSPILVLGECLKNDFFYVNISSFSYGNGSIDTCDAFWSLEKNLGENIEMELWEGRDGMFDDEEMYYVFSKDEVQQMVDELTEALKTGY